MVTHYQDKAGTTRWKGNKVNLKKSQAYTPGFGHAVKKMVVKNELVFRKHKMKVHVQARRTLNHMTKDMWDEAELESILKFLGICEA